MFTPSRDRFKANLQSGRPAVVMFTATDDVGIVVDSIRSTAAELGIDAVRIWPGNEDTFTVVAR